MGRTKTASRAAGWKALWLCLHTPPQFESSTILLADYFASLELSTILPKDPHLQFGIEHQFASWSPNQFGIVHHFAGRPLPLQFEIEHHFAGRSPHQFWIEHWFLLLDPLPSIKLSTTLLPDSHAQFGIEHHFAGRPHPTPPSLEISTNLMVNPNPTMFKTEHHFSSRQTLSLSVWNWVPLAGKHPS